jgi:two-component system, OmpR family, sensor kinase
VRRIPIRIRIALAFTAVMAILLAGLGLFIYLRFSSQLNATIDQGLESRSHEVATIVRQSDPDELRHGELLTPGQQGFSQIVDRSGRVLDTTPQLGSGSALSQSQLQRASQGPIFLERSGLPSIETSGRLLAAPVTLEHGEQLIVVVGTSLDQRQEDLSNLATVLLIGGPIALLLASLAGYFMAGAALRPVDAMRRRAAAISADQPDERLPVPAAEDELRRLGETLNAMLDRLETALERERDFVDDASHELRTPLALHKTELELALRYGGTTEELKASIASAIEETDRLVQLAEDLLVVARSEKDRLGIQLASVPIRQVFDDVGARFASRVQSAGRALEISPPGDSEAVEADRLRVGQALTNMVENALRHGRGRVGVFSRAIDGRIEIHVTDQGPGFPDGFIEHAFERFSRGDQARSGGGAGLGLAIVATIARAHGGAAHAANRNGGADVWIDLPAAGPRS